jgi:hypothetical protein
MISTNRRFASRAVADRTRHGHTGAGSSDRNFGRAGIPLLACELHTITVAKTRERFKRLLGSVLIWLGR